MKIEQIEAELQPLRKALRTHILYKKLTSLEDVQLFMQQHVYAVWDFMSLLKALQIHLTCVQLPWKPVMHSDTARFINEIVLEEETDRNEEGVFKSHFEMYLDAMQEIGSDTTEIVSFVDSIASLGAVHDSITSSSLHNAVKNFMSATFDVIKSKQPHKIAAAFTFGREDVIPTMFLEIVERTAKEGTNEYPKLNYYLKRHIELDGDEHGPLALRMMQALCGDDTKKWNEVLAISKNALEQRIALWDAIAEQISK